MSIRIYLDSSDFSDLSGLSEKLPAEDLKLLSIARLARQQNRAHFVLSPVHFAEAVHASTKYRYAALQRGRLMSDLCGQPTLRYPTRLFTLEIENALPTLSNGRLSDAEVFSAPHEWFGFNIPQFDKRAHKEQFNRGFQKYISQRPRHERRRLKSELDISRPPGRQRWRALIAQLDVPALEFPYNALEQELVFDWILGTKDDSLIRSAIIRLASDPYVMIANLIDETGQRSDFYSALRNEGQRFNASISGHLDKVAAWLRTHPEFQLPMPSIKQIDAMLPRSTFLREAAATFAESSTTHLNDEEVQRLVASCPALSTYTRALFARVLSLIDANRLKIMQEQNDTISIGKPSDFGDLMHASYIPYVDAFRCDSTFGGIFRQYKIAGTEIVDKRHKLTKILDRAQS